MVKWMLNPFLHDVGGAKLAFLCYLVFTKTPFVLNYQKKLRNPSRDHIHNIDDSLMLSLKKQAWPLKTQRCDIDATLMKHRWYRCIKTIIIMISEILMKQCWFIHDSLMILWRNIDQTVYFQGDFIWNIDVLLMNS